MSMKYRQQNMAWIVFITNWNLAYFTMIRVCFFQEEVHIFYKRQTWYNRKQRSTKCQRRRSLHLLKGCRYRMGQSCIRCLQRTLRASGTWKIQITGQRCCRPRPQGPLPIRRPQPRNNPHQNYGKLLNLTILLLTTRCHVIQKNRVDIETMYLAIVFYDGGHFLTMIKVLMLSITKRKRAYLLSVATKNISTSRLHHASLPLLKVHWGYAELRRQKSWIAVTAIHYDRHKQMGLPTCLARDKACQSSQNDTGDDPIKKLNNQGLPKCKQQISFDFCCLHGHHHNNRCWLIGFFIGLRV